MKIAVLLGGTSAERDVSLVTGVAISKALMEVGHQVLPIDCAYGDRLVDIAGLEVDDIIKETPADFSSRQVELDRNILKTIEFLIRESVDMVYIALHGGYGENGQLQALLEMTHIPYVGSNSTASALCMNKYFSKELVQAHGIPTAAFKIIKSLKNFESECCSGLRFPLVVKPGDQGSTVGLSIVKEKTQLREAIQEALKFSPFALIEEYIPGSELTVAILGEQALPVIEIVPQSGFYDYESKYQSGRTEYIVPAKIPNEISERVQYFALKAFRVLGCDDYARVDFRLRDDGKLFFLEVNTLPGMTPTSLVPKAARAIGMDFPTLIGKIVDMAWKRYHEYQKNGVINGYSNL